MVLARSRAIGAALVGAALLGMALAAAGCSESSEAEPKIRTTARPGIAPIPPAQGAFFGAWVEPPKTADDKERARIDELGRFEREIGRRLDIAQSFRGWETEFPRESEKSMLDGDRYLLLTWAGGDTREIVSGRDDGMIRERARAVKATGKPIFLRWQRDMEEAGIAPRVHSPADYIAAWKHLRQIFRQEKVDNVAWVWSPTAKGFGADNAPAYYPGDDQVDWIAADVYPGGHYEYRDYAEAVRLFMGWVKDRPKPIMISEFGAPRSYDVRRAEWLRNAAQHLQSPQVKAVVYYDSDRDSPDKPRYQFSVNGDANAMSALREMATTPFFNPRNLPVTSG